mmetsp:Transcript_117859/g.279678  ORF Transcript_117859/g.279678 Transcript_117859/m.279678 type:complete len:229 (-) Transcript_117859:169-855(-)
MRHAHLRRFVLIHRSITRHHPSNRLQIVFLLRTRAHRRNALLAFGLQVCGLVGRHAVELPEGGRGDLRTLDGLLEALLSALLPGIQVRNTGSQLASSSLHFVPHLPHLLPSLQQPLLRARLVERVLIGILVVAHLVHPICILLRLFRTLVAPAWLPVPFNLIPHKPASLSLLHVPFLHELVPSCLRLLFRNGLCPWKSEHFLGWKRYQGPFVAFVSRQHEEFVDQQLH